MTDIAQAKGEITEKFEGAVERGKTAESRLENYFNPKVEEQPEPTPSSNQTKEETPKEEDPEVETKVETTPEPDDLATPDTSTTSEEDEALANSKNPERTRAYIEKLKSQIREKEAKETQSQANYGTSVLDEFHPQVPQQEMPLTVQTPYLNPLQKDNMTQQFIDADGNVDINGLNKALSDANRNAYDAMLRAEEVEMRAARNQETEEVREAHAQYPEMDPGRKDTFNQILYDTVSARIAREMRANNGQRTTRLVDVVTQAKKELESKNKSVEQPKVEVKKEEVAKARAQGPFESGSAAKREASNAGPIYGDVKSRALNPRTMMRNAMNDPVFDDRLSNYFKDIK